MIDIGSRLVLASVGKLPGVTEVEKQLKIVALSEKHSLPFQIQFKFISDQLFSACALLEGRADPKRLCCGQRKQLCEGGRTLGAKAYHISSFRLYMSSIDQTIQVILGGDKI